MTDERVCEGDCEEPIPAGCGHVLLELTATMVGPGDRLFIPTRTQAVVCGPCYANGRWTRETIGPASTRFHEITMRPRTREDDLPPPRDPGKGRPDDLAARAKRAGGPPPAPVQLPPSVVDPGVVELWRWFVRKIRGERPAMPA